MDYATMTDDELVAENQRLGSEIDAIREQRYAIKAELDARDAQRRYERLGLSPVEIAALTAAAS